MSITIKRKTGYIGMLTKIQIKLNDEKVASIENNQQIDIQLPEGKALLKVTQFGTKSNEIEVKDGDIVKITMTKLNLMIVPLMFITIFITNRMPNLKYNLNIIAFLTVLILIASFFIEGFNIKILTHNDNYDE
jgi:hypothetical protein